MTTPASPTYVGQELDALVATEVLGWSHDRERAYEELVATAKGG